jgi:hypothetical protein
MMSSLPAGLLEVFERASSADLVTVDGRGRPVARPVTPSFDARALCLELEPAPSEHDRHVAVLVSGPPMILVQGTASVGGVAVRVRPERLYVWPGLDPEAEPELYDAHVEEVRSGHNEEPEVGHPAPEGGAIAWDERLDRLDATAVLGFVGPDGFPFAVRVPVRADPAARVVRIDADPVGAPIEPGLGCLCARPLRVNGDLDEEGGRWVLRPHEVAEAEISARLR